MPTISFHVTPSQKETIRQRAEENGFDDLSSYAKVVALKTESVNLTAAGASEDTPDIEITFEVTDAQKELIESRMKASECEDMNRYLSYAAQHAVINSVIEIRSSGSLDDMLARITASKKK